MIEVKECPFCSHIPVDGYVNYSTSFAPVYHRVLCNNCGSCGPAAKTMNLATNKWNMRNDKSVGDGYVSNLR